MPSKPITLQAIAPSTCVTTDSRWGRNGIAYGQPTGVPGPVQQVTTEPSCPPPAPHGPVGAKVRFGQLTPLVKTVIGKVMGLLVSVSPESSRPLIAAVTNSVMRGSAIVSVTLSRSFCAAFGPMI